MSKINQLKDFMTKEETRNDPFWKSILQSDARNIFPKHQLAKIEITKNKMSKMRLIMEQLPNFLSLQIYAKNIEQVSKTQLDNDIKKELDQLSLDLEQCKSSNTPSDYQFEVLECKEKLEYFCRELGKSKIKPELKEVMQKSQKWKNYLESNTKQTSKLDPILNEKEKCDLAFVIGLEKVDDCLLTGTSSKIIEERIKQKVFMDRLKDILLNQSEDINLQVANDPWKQEWEAVVKQLKEPVCYV